MSDTSPILALPYLMPAQAQKHVTHNEALQRLDVLVQTVVESFGATLPPDTPVEGEVHAPGPGATGPWAGQEGHLALWLDGAWSFVALRPGWRAWGRADNRLRLWDGTAWVALPVDTDGLAGVGIGTAHDATNRLAVVAPAALLTHAGAGHQLKINKAAAAETGSVLFQSNWSGRAELGAIGDDNFTLKVSADGAVWKDALRADRTTGVVAVPNGLDLGGSLTGTAVTQSSADGTAGRLTKVGDFGWGLASSGLANIADWNRTDAPSGVYAFGATTLSPEARPPGYSPGNFGIVRIERFNNDFFKQSASRAAASNPEEIWERRHANGTWTEWKQVYNQGTVVGPASQSGGKPTGALLERGSNANGEYLRFADGTQECWRSLAGTVGAASLWTFPAAFAGAPVVTGSVVATSLSVMCLEAVPSHISASVSARDASGRRADTMHLVARGRWF